MIITKKKKKSTSYHVQVSFIVEDKLILPHVLYLGHIFWEQQSLLYGRGYMAPYAAVEVP